MTFILKDENDFEVYRTEDPLERDLLLAEDPTIQVEEIETLPFFDSSEKAIIAMNAWIERFLVEKFTGHMPDQEIASLGDKGRAAINYKEGTANIIETSLIETGAALREMGPSEYCDKVILPKAIPYAKAVATTAELRSKYTKLLAEGDSSTFGSVLSSAQKEAFEQVQLLLGN